MPAVLHLQRPLALIAALAVLLSLALVARPFTRDGFPTGHDATAHITYTFLFDRALSQGQVPVRWVEWVRPGESQPLFNFYPPGLYYLVEIVHLVVPRLSTALKSTIVLLWWTGALFMFMWLRRLGWMPAALAAVLFAWSPYLILDVFVRGAYPEMAAMACAPGLLWSIDRLLRSARPTDALWVASLVGAMLTLHLLSSLIFAPVVAAYVMYRLFEFDDRARRAGLLVAGVAIGMGLSTFYVLPSMAELDHVAIGRMTSGYSDYQQHFVAPSQWLSRKWGYGASVPGVNDDMPLQIGIVQWLVIALAVAMLFFTTRARRAAFAFWLAMLGAAMFVMTDSSAFLWRAIPALPYLQFPWRYFMVISLGAAALSAWLLASVKNRTLQALLLVTVIGWQYQLHGDHLTPASEIPRREMSIDNPRWPDMQPMGAFLERGFTPIAARREAPDDIGRWTVMDGNAEVRPIHLADDRMELDVRTSTGVRLRLSSHAFPGWLVYVNGALVTVAVEPRHGYMEVTLAAGTHHLDARFTNTPVRTIANTISVASLVIGVLIFVRSWRGGRELTSVGRRFSAAGRSGGAP